MQQEQSQRQAWDDQPPPYARAVSRVYTRNLAGPVLALCIIAAIWSLLVGISYLRGLNDVGETSKLRMADIVFAALCFVATGTEAFGLAAAITRRLVLVKQYLWLSFFNVALFIGIGILKIIFHVALKKDITAQCFADNQGDMDLSSGTAASNQQISDYCNTQHTRYIYYDIAWLIGLIIFALLSLSVSSAFYHQAKNPQSNRIPPSSAYRMNPYGNQDPPFQPPGFAPPSMPPPDYKNDPPLYSGDYSGNLAEKGQTQAYEHEQGYDTRQQSNESEMTLKGVDLHDDAADLSTPTRRDHVI